MTEGRYKHDHWTQELLERYPEAHEYTANRKLLIKQCRSVAFGRAGRAKGRTLADSSLATDGGSTRDGRAVLTLAHRRASSTALKPESQRDLGVGQSRGYQSIAAGKARTRWQGRCTRTNPPHPGWGRKSSSRGREGRQEHQWQESLR